MGERLEMGLAVRTRNGEELRQDLRYPLMSEGEIQEKFRNLAGLRMGVDHVLDLEQKLLAVEQEGNVASLFQQLEVGV